jgi:hypothetical protein
MPVPIRETAAGIDLSARVFVTTTVGASPALAAETIIGTVTTSGDIAALAGIVINAWAAFTVGTSGVSAQMRVRQTNVAGTIVANSGAVTATAAALTERSILGFDAAAVLPGQVYVLTLQVASGAAASTVSALTMIASVI